MPNNGKFLYCLGFNLLMQVAIAMNLINLYVNKLCKQDERQNIIINMLIITIVTTRREY